MTSQISGNSHIMYIQGQIHCEQGNNPHMMQGNGPYWMIKKTY